jgi:hypothetical protein
MVIDSVVGLSSNLYKFVIIINVIEILMQETKLICTTVKPYVAAIPGWV